METDSEIERKIHESIDKSIGAIYEKYHVTYRELGDGAVMPAVHYEFFDDIKNAIKSAITTSVMGVIHAPAQSIREAKEAIQANQANQIGLNNVYAKFIELEKKLELPMEINLATIEKAYEFARMLRTIEGLREIKQDIKDGISYEVEEIFKEIRQLLE